MPVCEVRDPVDVFHVQRSVSKAAAALGFEKRACSELAIVGSELASNILKYGVSGHVEIAAVEDEHGPGIALVATDRGPPFRNLDAAMRDGWDDRGPIDPVDMLKRKGIGGGLGAIARLSHSFRVEQLDGGKRIHVVRYLVPPRKKRRSERTKA
ncbi:MAG TPA: ATP-binding protein [Polyangiaceae bacterium]|nr:ATP-binding protein [Polyangiaceae bacterium]